MREGSKHCAATWELYIFFVCGANNSTKLGKFVELGDTVNYGKFHFECTNSFGYKTAINRRPYGRFHIGNQSHRNTALQYHVCCDSNYRANQYAIG
jgi:hypothetical protein